MEKKIDLLLKYFITKENLEVAQFNLSQAYQEKSQLLVGTEPDLGLEKRVVEKLYGQLGYVINGMADEVNNG